MSTRPDPTRNERQARRRGRERKWLDEHKFTSWEAVHTKIMNGEMMLKEVKQKRNKSKEPP